MDSEALAIGRSLSDTIPFLAAGAKAIPLPDASVDCVISRVALPYTDFPRAVREIARVLTPGGSRWMTLRSVGFGLRVLWIDLRRLHLMGIVYRSYVLTNGLRLHLTGTVDHYPLKRSRMESVQTTRAVRRAFTARGFRVIEITHQRGAFLLIAVRHA